MIFFELNQSGGEYNSALLKKLKWTMAKKGLDGKALDHPDLIVPNQPGSDDSEVKNLHYDKGLRFGYAPSFILVEHFLFLIIKKMHILLVRYCLDTFIDPMDWRRKGMETCYE